MAYTSLTALPLVYPQERAGGLRKVYFVAYSDTVPDATGNIATITSGLVSAVSLGEAITFVGVEPTRGSSEITSDFAGDFAKGSGYYKTTLKVFLTGLTVANQAFIQNLIMRPVAVIVWTLEGNYYLAGADGRLQLLSYTSGSGTAPGDGPGYTLTFEGTGIIPMNQVDPTLMATIAVG